jgi:hypothetical protein
VVLGSWNEVFLDGPSLLLKDGLWQQESVLVMGVNMKERF